MREQRHVSLAKEGPATCSLLHTGVLPTLSNYFRSHLASQASIRDQSSNQESWQPKQASVIRAQTKRAGSGSQVELNVHASKAQSSPGRLAGLAARHGTHAAVRQARAPAALPAPAAPAPGSEGLAARYLRPRPRPSPGHPPRWLLAAPPCKCKQMRGRLKQPPGSCARHPLICVQGKRKCVQPLGSCGHPLVRVLGKSKCVHLSPCLVCCVQAHADAGAVAQK